MLIKTKVNHKWDNLTIGISCKLNMLVTNNPAADNSYKEKDKYIDIFNKIDGN